MIRFRCSVCNYIYDEDKEGRKYSDLPDSWTCPVCDFLPKNLVKKFKQFFIAIMSK